MRLELDFTIRQGSFELQLCDVKLEAAWTAILGPSGSGKTTLLDCVSGMRRIDSGRILLDGEPFSWIERNVEKPLQMRHVGCVHQEGLLFPHMTVERNIRYGWHRRPGAITPEHVVEVLEIGDLLSRHPREISGGQAQRVALARALCSNPRLLLVDEPLASLDREIKSRIIDYLGRIKNEFGVPALYVTHERAEAEKLADEVLILERGNLKAQGRPEEVLA